MMARRRDYTISLALFILLFVYVMGEQRFAQEPEDVTAKHGQSVSLSCQITDRKGAVQWTKDGFGLGTDPNLQGFNRYKMIINETEGVYNLYIQPVLVEDDGVYQCQVGGAEGEKHLKSKNAKLTVHFPPADTPDQVYLDKPSPMNTKAGAPVRIICEAGLSTPPSSIQWYMNGNKGVSGAQINTTKIKQGSSILTAVKSILDLTPSREHHDVNISCEVNHEALDKPIVRSLTMTVKYPPTVNIEVDSQKIKEHENVKFTCSGEGNPPELRYRWEMNSVSVVGDHTDTYLIPDIQRQANGAKVACIVSNSIGSNKSVHTLSVEYSPRFKVEPQDVDEDEGKQVTLTCDVDGNPPPEIVWLHDTQQKVINLGAKLVVTVRPDTVGVYHCRAAVTGFPEESRSMRVFMRGAPVVTPKQEQFGLEGDTVPVQCDINSIPRPTEIVWTKDKHVINPNESRYNILQERTNDGVRNTLVILDARRQDFGTYNCTAKNGYGSDTGSILLKRQQSLPLVTTLVAIIGGIVFLIVVIVVIVLFKKKGRGYKDSGLEKHSMRSSDRSSTHDSVLKVETRTATGSDLSPSEDDYSSHEDWDGSERSIPVQRPPELRYQGDYNDPVFPIKHDGPNNNTSGGYVQYVDYSRDYNPPPPITYNRNSIYAAPILNNVDPRYSAAYGNPYLKVPQTARTQSAIYSSSGGLDSGTPLNTPTGGQFGGTAPVNLNNNNTLNNSTSNTALYAPINRNNLRGSTNLNNQYITMPQDGRLGVQGTHI